MSEEDAFRRFERAVHDKANLERFIVHPDVVLARRFAGPVEQRVSFAEVDLQLNLTGGKTWRGLAPFVGLGLGLALARWIAQVHEGDLSLTRSSEAGSTFTALLSQRS